MCIFFLQTAIPPIPPGDENGFLIWTIGVLVAVVGSVFGLYLKSIQQIKETNELRIADRDKILDEKENTIKQLRLEKDKLLHEILPSLTASNTIGKTLLQLLKNER